MREKIRKIGKEIWKKYWRIILAIFVIGLFVLWSRQQYLTHKSFEKELYSLDSFLNRKCEMMILKNEYKCSSGISGEDFFTKLDEIERTLCLGSCTVYLEEKYNKGLLDKEWDAYILGVRAGLKAK